MSNKAPQSIPKEYQQTEVGVIPYDWDVETIGNLCSITTGSKNTQDKISEGLYPFFVRSQTIERINSYSFDGEAVLTAGDGVGTGKIFHYINGKFDIHQRVYKMSGFNDDLDGFFFYKYFSSRFYGRIMSMTAKSSVDSVRREMIADMFVAVPPKKEQTAIANALSDVDALITSLEKLIAKKRVIKTAVMQQLLTGKKRLPPFDQTHTGYKKTELGEIPEDWDVFELADFVSALDAGISVNSVEDMGAFGHGKAILKTSCIAGGYFYPSEAKGIIPKDVKRAKLNPKKGNIIISRMNTPDLVGEIGYIDDNYGNLFLPDRLWQTKYRSGVDVSGRWLAFMLSYPDFAKQIKESATGTSNSMKNISKGSLLSTLLSSPSFKEQQAIADFLSGMDDDIDSLEQRLSKTRKIKHGMMQELLTGRTRLV